MILLDTSVWAQRKNHRIYPWFSAALLAGEIALCDMVAMELLHYQTTAAAYLATATDLDRVPWIHMTQADWTRAREVQGRLTAQRPRSLHRSVKIADLLIAACAERAGVALIHYDQDFETIGAVTMQPIAWVLPRGSI